MIKPKFFLSVSQSFLENSLLNFFFTKYLYTKFLIIKVSTTKRKNLILLDNHLCEFIIKLKKRSKRLNSKLKTKVGDFLKADIFLCKHSKLNSFFFFALGFKTYIKKNILTNLNIIKTMFTSISHVFVYKSIRGGFFGFSNNIFGYISRIFLLKSKYKLLRYKKYCILLGGGFLSSNFKKKTFFFFDAGFNRKLKKKAYNHNCFFKRFKFFFSSKSLFLLAFLKQLHLLRLKQLLQLYPFKSYLINNFLKLKRLLI